MLSNHRSSGKSILSIIGCGWLGLPLGTHLSKRGFIVKGSTTNPDKFKVLEQGGIQPYHILLDPELSSDAKDFFDSDVLIINLPPGNQKDEPNYHRIQLQSLRSRAKGSGVKHVLFVSSTSVYPSKNQEVTEEDAETDQLTRSGISLLEMEHLFSQDPFFKTTVVRFGGLYGPDRHPGRFLAGRKNIAGGSNPINMIHLDDCLRILTQVIEGNIWGEVFNAVSPSNTTRKDFYLNASAELGVDPPIFSDQPAAYKQVMSHKLIKRLNYHFLH